MLLATSTEAVMAAVGCRLAQPNLRRASHALAYSLHAQRKIATPFFKARPVAETLPLRQRPRRDQLGALPRALIRT